MSDSYDQLPYQTFARRESHPTHLYSLAKLFGRDAVHPANARVLELGCGTGGNLVPMADEFPGATFLGVDLGEKHIGQARALASGLGLKNVRFARKSIADITRADGEFDYLICHGVFSWVPEPVRRHILKLCRESLSPNGIAYLSYNALPGWRFRGAVREMMLYHSTFFETPEEKIRESVGLVEFLAQLRSGTQDGYSLTLREVDAKLKQSQPHYIFHEFLEAENKAYLFHDFLTLTGSSDLGYLTDAKLHLTFGEDLPAEVQRVLRQFEGDPLRQEQYLDFIRNRSFRESILFPGKSSAQAPRWNGLKSAHFSSTLSRRLLKKDPEATPSVDANEGRDHVERALLEVLADAWPETRPFSEMVLFGVSEQLVLERLRALLMRGVIEMQVIPRRLTREPGAKPRTTAWARFLATRLEVVTSPLHVSLPLSEAARVVIAQLDGTVERSQIRATLDELFAGESAVDFDQVWAEVRDAGFFLTEI